MLDKLKELKLQYEKEMSDTVRGSERWLYAFGEKMRLLGRIEQIEVYNGQR